MTVCAVNQVPFNIIRDRLADAFHTLTQHASNFPGISFEYADVAGLCRPQRLTATGPHYRQLLGDALPTPHKQIPHTSNPPWISFEYADVAGLYPCVYWFKDWTMVDLTLSTLQTTIKRVTNFPIGSRVPHKI